MNVIEYMKKLVGYIVSGVGLLVMVAGISNYKLGISVLDTIGETYIIGAGVVLVVAGVVLSMTGKGGSSKVEHDKAEVPIYEGVGKNRKIVGYQRGKE